MTQHSRNLRPATFRWMIRAATDDAHRRLDERVSALDIASWSGCAAYLRMNARATAALAMAAPAEPQWTVALDALCEAALADLRALGAQPPEPMRPAGTLGLGAMYVCAGSRLGGRVLAKRVATSDDRRLQGIFRFFARGPMDALWPQIVAQLDAVPKAEEAIHVAEALATFQLFQDALPKAAG